MKMKRIKRTLAAGALSLAALGGGVGLVVASGPVAVAANSPYRVPDCGYDKAGPGLKNWHGYSKQDGWSKWFYTKAGCNTAAVEHWGDVTRQD